MMDAIIAKLESKGFSRWTKGKYDRLYVNASTLGLSCTYHRTGSEDVSTFNGESISNSEARRMKNTKCYIDVATGEVVCDNGMMREAAEAVLASCEEPEVVEAEADEAEAEVEVVDAVEADKIDAAEAVKVDDLDAGFRTKFEDYDNYHEYFAAWFDEVLEILNSDAEAVNA